METNQSRPVSLVRKLALAGATAFLFTAPPALALEVTQSSLDGSDGNDLTASDFAGIMALYIQPGEIHDAKFFFQECFGGGMLPPLQSAFDDNIKWIGGSASTADEPSWGPADPTSKPDFWTAALAPELAKPNQQLGTTLTNASNNDVFGPMGAMRETPQTAGSTDGNTIKMSDGTSHHAIIWTGAKDADRHDNDVTAITNALNTAWAGSPAGSTSITMVSTTAQLEAAMQFLSDNGDLNPDEEFLFYATDHGDQQTTIIPDNPTIGGGTMDHETLTLDPTVIAAIRNSDPAHTPPQPTLEIDYSGLTVFDPIFFDGHLLGQLDPSLTDMIFNLDIAWLLTVNDILIDNSLNPSSFIVSAKIFDTGSVNNSVVPEPGSLALLGVALASLFVLNRRRTQRATDTSLERSAPANVG